MKFVTSFILSEVLGLASALRRQDDIWEATQHTFTHAAPCHTSSQKSHINGDYEASFPNVTLGYGIHQVTGVNEDAGYLHYKNIRYGQNPIGDLRFSPSKAPEDVHGDLPVFNGADGKSCWQGMPAWVIATLKAGDPTFDWESHFRTETDGDDCLFLDVARPITIADDASLPVLVWIYGGGYVYGAKDMDLYTPAGFFRRAGGHQFVYVALNYRMGAFGFLSGPKFAEQGGQPNLALYDQRLALQWVQDNIAKFGGDPNQVTVMGESAGAGSITHQMVFTGDGPAKKTPFKKAIIQSPAWVRVPGTKSGLDYQDAKYDAFLEFLNVTDLAGARAKSPEELKAANRALVGAAPHGTFTFGPVVDGTTIKDDPLALFRAGKQNTSVEIFTGDVSGEGLPFIPVKREPLFPAPGFEDYANDDLLDYIHNALPLMKEKVSEEILGLYPLQDDEYRDITGVSAQSERLADIAGQALVQCNSRGISTASGNNTFNYFFNVVTNKFPYLPVLHGGDVPYTFFDVPTNPPTLNAGVATIWQKYIMGFVLKSDPNLLSPFKRMNRYGEEANVIKFSYLYTANQIEDPYKGERCDAKWPKIWGEYGVEKKRSDADEKVELK